MILFLSLESFHSTFSLLSCVIKLLKCMHIMSPFQHSVPTDNLSKINWPHYFNHCYPKVMTVF